MSPIMTSIAGLAATLTGACAMLLMLELRGNPREDSKVNQRLITAHKVTGYIYRLFYCHLSCHAFQGWNLSGRVFTKDHPAHFAGASGYPASFF
ncbi:hypothetical protein VU02_02765 [Desulfobulbus sp. N2]|nr:hypothetical protein [Desulfobulbus sp. N2]